MPCERASVADREDGSPDAADPATGDGPARLLVSPPPFEQLIARTPTATTPNTPMFFDRDIANLRQPSSALNRSVPMEGI
jgi:hypothetical protein